MSTHLQTILSTAIEAAIAGGKAIMEIYKTEDFGVDMKSDNSPLTKADIAANNCILDFLNTTNIPVLSEEGRAIPYEERKNWNRLWIVDPLDGTKEFIKRNGEFTVNIALIEDQIPVLGVVFTPVLNELYFATKEIGAYKLTIREGQNISEIIEKAERLPLKNDRNDFTIVASRSHMSAETEAFIAEQEKLNGKVNLLSKGSSLKLCMVAEGSADCYPRFAPTMEWDTAAGQSICMYAGAKVTDYSTGKMMLYNRENLLNNWFLVQR